MIYVDNDSINSQLIYIPRDDEFEGATGHTLTLQRKDYVINENGVTHIHPDYPEYDGISGGTISVYVSAATGVTFEDLEVTENGRYVPSGDSVYTGVTVNVPGYDEGYHDGFEAGYSSGVTDGYSSGHTDGYNEGYSSGVTDGYNSGSTEGFDAGYASGFTEGYASGQTDGYSSGMTDGYASGYTAGFEAGYSSGRTDGYAEGYQDGMAAQRALLGELSATTNGTYTSETGYSAVTVDVASTGSSATLSSETFTLNGQYTPPQGVDGWSAVTVSVDTASTYQEGYEDGEAAQKSRLQELTATTNHFTYIDQDGYSAVTVNVDTSGDYSSGYTEGMAAQKALLASTAFTANGTYQRENGWNEVEVAVPLSSLQTTINTNGVHTFDPQDYGVEGFSYMTLNVWVSKPVYRLTITTTAQSQSVRFTQDTVAGYPTNFVFADISGIGVVYSKAYIFETPDTYVVTVSCADSSPIVQLTNDSAITNIEILSGCTALDYFRISQGLPNLSGITFQNGSMVMAIPYGFYRPTSGSTQVHYFEAPDSVFDMGSRAFEDADLYQVKLGENVTSIGYKAFANNANLTSVICKNPYGVHPADNVFEQVPSGGTLIIPCGSTAAYTASGMIAALPSGWNVVEDC